MEQIKTQKQYADAKIRNGNLTTLTFQENWNMKLYGKYFTTIRQASHPIKLGDTVDIVLKGKGVKLAKCIGCQIVKFSELNELTIMMDTGFNYAESLQLFKRFGLDVHDFNLEVKYILLETI